MIDCLRANKRLSEWERLQTASIFNDTLHLLLALANMHTGTYTTVLVLVPVPVPLLLLGLASTKC
jgi:hypothetical protein